MCLTLNASSISDGGIMIIPLPLNSFTVSRSIIIWFAPHDLWSWAQYWTYSWRNGEFLGKVETWEALNLFLACIVICEIGYFWRGRALEVGDIAECFVLGPTILRWSISISKLRLKPPPLNRPVAVLNPSTWKNNSDKQLKVRYLVSRKDYLSLVRSS